jgi:hypothetical protein
VERRHSLALVHRAGGRIEKQAAPYSHQDVSRQEREKQGECLQDPAFSGQWITIILL